MNICGCLVHARPEAAAQVEQDLSAIDGVEIHGRSEDGRFVVVVEDIADKRASDIIMDLHQVPGVLSLTLTYHHFEELPEPQVLPQRTSQSGAQTHDHL